MDKKKIVAIVLMAAFLLPFLSATGFAAEKVSKIKVGLMFGLTGAASPIGPVQLQGAKLAIK
jgi:branched-chain amino acid transport system substrate-binding protein